MRILMLVFLGCASVAFAAPDVVAKAAPKIQKVAKAAAAKAAAPTCAHCQKPEARNSSCHECRTDRSTAAQQTTHCRQCSLWMAATGVCPDCRDMPPHR
jgi:hypothetical protein